MVAVAAPSFEVWKPFRVSALLVLRRTNEQWSGALCRGLLVTRLLSVCPGIHGFDGARLYCVERIT